jgi:hypothetical protein
MAGKGKVIYRLAQKVDLCCETLFEAKKINDKSRKELAKLAGIPLATLKSACQKEQVSYDLQSKLAKVCNFSCDDEVWDDRNVSDEEKRKPHSRYIGKDTPAAFRQKLRQNWGLVRLSGLRLQGNCPVTVDRDLATFSISDCGQTTSPTEAIDAFLQLDMRPLHDERGYSYGFQKVYVNLIFPSTSNTEIQSRLGHPKVTNLREATLRARGNAFHPCWEIFVEDGFLQGEFSTKDAPLFQLVDQNPGLEFDADLAVQLYDGTLVRADSKPPVGKNKSAIIARLMAKKIQANNDANGWLKLVVQRLKIEGNIPS